MTEIKTIEDLEKVKAVFVAKGRPVNSPESFAIARWVRKQDAEVNNENLFRNVMKTETYQRTRSREYEERKKIAIELYLKGVPYDDIAKELGVARGTVENYVKGHTVYRMDKRKKELDERKKQAYYLHYERHMKPSKIAEVMHRGYNTILRYLAEEREERRAKSENQS